MLCFKDSGEEGTKELSLELPRENFMANMIKQPKPIEYYDANIEDEKRQRIELEIGITVKLVERASVNRSNAGSLPNSLPGSPRKVLAKQGSASPRKVGSLLSASPKKVGDLNPNKQVSLPAKQPSSDKELSLHSC